MVNDDFGHREGDAALVRFAGHLRQACRESDLVARLGGDEFALLLNDADDAEVELVLERLADLVASDAENNNRGYRLRYSLGKVKYDPQSHASLGELLEAGDRLMYRHKRGLDTT